MKTLDRIEGYTYKISDNRWETTLYYNGDVAAVIASNNPMGNWERYSDEIKEKWRNGEIFYQEQD